MDPRFKLRWCQPDNVDKTVSLMKEKVSVIQTTDVEDDSTSESPPLKKDRKEDFFSFLPPSTPTQPRTRNPSGYVSEVDIYISEDCIEMTVSPLNYWSINESRFPNLANIAMKYLAIPATSTVETFLCS